MPSTAKEAAPLTVLVTGANRGLGKALVEEFKRLGDDVYGAYRPECEQNQLKDMLGANVLELDLASVESIVSASMAWGDKKLDILINNATLYDDPEAEYQYPMAGKMAEAFNVNALGPLLLTKYLFHALQEAKVGRVVNIIDRISDEESLAKYVAYHASKMAMESVTLSMAAMHASRDIKVTVVGIHPGSSNVEDPAEKIVHTIKGLEWDDNSRLMDWRGVDLVGPRRLE
ncbi:hypothetical protein RB595_001848 [Gaeumannomyces hyphopodioides]